MLWAKMWMQAIHLSWHKLKRIIPGRTTILHQRIDPKLWFGYVFCGVMCQYPIKELAVTFYPRRINGYIVESTEGHPSEIKSDWQWVESYILRTWSSRPAFNVPFSFISAPPCTWISLDVPFDPVEEHCRTKEAKRPKPIFKWGKYERFCRWVHHQLGRDAVGACLLISTA